MIPNYRIRFYCLIGTLICGLGMTACTEQMLNALFYQAIDVTTGRGVHRAQEHLTLAESPIRFCWHFCFFVLGAVASSYGTYKLGRGVLLGRAAYKQWQLPEWKN